jgi:hypothetical protein
MRLLHDGSFAAALWRGVRGDWAKATADPEARAALSAELADLYRALGDKSEADRLAAEARAFGWAVPRVDRELAVAARAQKAGPLVEAGDLDGAVATLGAATARARTVELVPVLRAVLQAGRADLLPPLAALAAARPKKPATGDYAWALAEADRCARLAVGSPEAAAGVLAEALALADETHTAEIAWIVAMRGLTDLRDAALARVPAGAARARVYVGAFDFGARAGVPEPEWLERAEADLTRPEYATVIRRAEVVERWATADPSRIPAALHAAYVVAGAIDFVPAHGWSLQQVALACARIRRPVDALDALARIPGARERVHGHLLLLKLLLRGSSLNLDLGAPTAAPA